MTTDHVRELALGLERSGARFLWAVRRPAGHSGGALPLLPDGFEARVAGRGVARAGWVPQVRVRQHAAVGAFLTHCGWGSTVESIFRFGLPLVMLPFVVDQGLIARSMAAHGVGVEVPRDDDDGSFRGDDVAAAVRRVMAADQEEGRELARNARELQKVVGVLGTGRGRSSTSMISSSICRATNEFFVAVFCDVSRQTCTIRADQRT